MPAPAKYEYVPDQLRRLAVDAKARGLSFEEWWHEALPVRVCKVCGEESLLATCPVIAGHIIEGRIPIECGAKTKGPVPPTFAEPRGAGPLQVLWPTDAVERRAWLGGVDSGRDGWQDAYEGREARPRHRALARLREHLRHIDSEGNPRSLAVA